MPTPPASGAPASSPSKWGRVAEDGTVYVRTAEGERSVGSYPGAAHDEALAYFGRKYDEIEGKVTLLEQRLAAGGVAPKDAATSIGHLREEVTDAHAVGDLDGLLARLGTLDGQVAERRKEADAARQAARAEAQVLKEGIVAEAETLSTSTDWKRTGDRMRALLDEWKAAARLDRKTDDALWKRFSHARTSFDKNRRAHFAELDSQRSEAAERKEEAHRGGRRALDVDRLGTDRAPLSRPDDRVEGSRARSPRRRGRAVEPVPARAGHVLQRPQRGLQHP